MADSRVEFAFQQRNADGAWSERLLPRAYSLPVNAVIGRLLNNSVLDQPVGYAQDCSHVSNDCTTEFVTALTYC